MTLDQLEPGHRVRVVSLAGEGAFRRRLMELGLVPGTVVERVGRPGARDPLAFLVRRATVALRRNDAAGVTVEEP